MSLILHNENRPITKLVPLPLTGPDNVLSIVGYSQLCLQYFLHAEYRNKAIKG